MTTSAYVETISSKTRLGIDHIPIPPALQELAKIADRIGEKTVRNTTCELCGCESQLGFLILHHIVPEHVARWEGIEDSRVTGLCISCHSAVHDWYGKKVSRMPYDTKTRQFLPKLPAEIVSEYQTAYEDFARQNK